MNDPLQTPVQDTLLRDAVERAILAPSSHNSQPWRFAIRDGAIEVFADRSRALPIVDPAGRELVASCGAALFHLRCAIECAGHEAPCELLPDAERPDVLARVTLGARRTPEATERRMLDAMLRRRTHRARFMDLEVSATLLALLAEDAELEGAWFAVVGAELDRLALADLIAGADREQWQDPLFREELAAWMHGNRDGRSDGLPGYALGRGDLAARVAPYVVRTFDRGDGEAARDRELAEHSPVLAVLGTDGDTPLDWLMAGQALARVLLHATAEGVSASFLNQPVEVPRTRAIVRDLVGRGAYPQLVLRMGYGYDVRATPRHPVSDVLVGAS